MDLNEVINNIDDITDPMSMETILMYVDYIQAQDEDFIELLLQKLPLMEITWEQPWYQQSNSLTRPVVPKGDVKEAFRNDRITEKEIRLIRKNWRKFRKQFGIPDNPECFARWKNTSKCRSPQAPEEQVRRFVVAYLAKGLERNLYQVYKHVLALYSSPIKGAYSLQEEKLMEVCFYHNARNAIPILSKVLGRDARGIYKRLQEWLYGKEKVVKMRWNLPVAEKFLKYLLIHTGVPLEQLKNKRLEKSIWMKLQSDMNHPYIYLQKFWVRKLHVQIFVKKDVKLNKLRRKIAQKLQKYPYSAWRDIRWKELLKEFPDGFTDVFLHMVWSTIFIKLKGYINIPLDELIAYALQRIPSMRNRRLRTLAFNNGNLLEVRYKAHSQ